MDYFTEEIVEYICKLDKCIDDDIFQKDTLADLGEFYYTKVITRFPTIRLEDLNKFVSRYTKNTSQKAYYEALCEYLSIKKLPKEIILEVRKEFNKLLNRFNVLCNNADVKISNINISLQAIKDQTNTLKNSLGRPNVLQDISDVENNIIELCEHCNKLRTYKEMLLFTKEYTVQFMMSFCDIYNSVCVENKVREVTISFCQDIGGGRNVSELFLSQNAMLDASEDNVDRLEGMFFKIKLMPIIWNMYKISHDNSFVKDKCDVEKMIEEYKKNIPTVDELILKRNNDCGNYLVLLQQVIDEYDIYNFTMNHIETCVCLQKRKTVLMHAINLLKGGQYELFNNIIPIQIEGIFNDFLMDVTTFSRFDKMDLFENAVLKEKIEILQSIKGSIYPEAVEYFMYYFNNLIRNKIAHGRGNDIVSEIDAKIFSAELLLDFNALLYMISRNSETEKMVRYVKSHAEINTGNKTNKLKSLLYSLLGRQTHYDYDMAETFRPIKVLYWLLNPYYEKLYKQVQTPKSLYEIRAVLLSEEFWGLALNELKKDSLWDINAEFKSVVNSMFRCAESSEVKQCLIEINKILATKC